MVLICSPGHCCLHVVHSGKISWFLHNQTFLCRSCWPRPSPPPLLAPFFQNGRNQTNWIRPPFCLVQVDKKDFLVDSGNCDKFICTQLWGKSPPIGAIMMLPVIPPPPFHQSIFNKVLKFQTFFLTFFFAVLSNSLGQGNKINLGRNVLSFYLNIFNSMTQSFLESS